MANNRTVVSIVCITFNQSKYIKQTLDSFLSQKTDFEYEILIHDDCSNDGTTEIVEEYAKLHPKIIKPYYEKENQYSQGYFDFINQTFAKSQGDFIAFCEGDDYWEDDYKLQIQVDYMRSHPKASLCFHPVRVIFENGEQPEYFFPESLPSKLDLYSLLENNFIQSNSVLYRKQKINYASLPSGIIPSDWYLHLFHAANGTIAYIDKSMAVYRRQEEGVWWNAFKNIDKIWLKHGLGHLRMYDELLKLFQGDDRAHKIIIAHINNITNSFIEVDKKYQSTLLHESVSTFPHIVEPLIIAKYEKLHYKELEFIRLKEKNKHQEEEFLKRMRGIERELSLIKSSKTWKLRTRVASYLKRP